MINFRGSLGEGWHRHINIIEKIMIYKDNLEPFFEELTRLTTQGKRCFFIINYPLTEAYLLDLTATEGSPQLYFDYGYAYYPIKSSEVSQTPSPSRLLEKHPEPISRYAQRFEIVHDALQRGEISLINLTLATPIDCPLTLADIYSSSRAKYKVMLPHQFVCFSPERFVHINPEGIITSHPMKGTIRADIPNAAQVILDDPKEIAEHTDMVESMKEELKKVGQNVSVPRFRYIDRIDTEQGGLLQVSSEVRAELSNDWRLRSGKILQTLLPAGSIAGIPKDSAIKYINQAEQHHRGYYSGISGYFDGQELETSVMIRFIQQLEDGSLIFHSGGGVTINSICEKEYQEVLEKIYLPI